MDRVTRSEGFGRAPWHGFFHTVLSLIILGISAFLFHKFGTGEHYVKRLHDVYLYDLIVSTLAIAGGVLICLPIIGRPIVLAIALLLPLLYIGGFGWTEFEHHRVAERLDFHRTATALVVFLGFAAFLGFLAFLSEVSMLRRATRSTKGGAAA